MVADTADRGGDLEQFRSAGRILFTMGLVKGAEGNLSTFDGAILRITRTGAELDHLAGEEVLTGRLDGTLDGASTDLEVHRAMYRDQGSGAVVHAHPAGTVPEGAAPGRHGVYVFGSTLDTAVAEVVRRTRTPGAAS